MPPPIIAVSAVRSSWRFFGVTPPPVHQMVLGLEKAGLIRRQPNTPRRIEITIDPGAVPRPKPEAKPEARSSVTRR